VSAGFTNPFYQWQMSKNNGSSWENITGAQSISYLVPHPMIPGNYIYRLAVFEKNNEAMPSCFVTSNKTEIRIHAKPVPRASSEGQCTGEKIILNANDGISYTWTGPLNFFSNEKNPQIVNATLPNTGKYFVEVVNEMGCSIMDSTNVLLEVAPTIDAGADLEICEGEQVQL